MPSFSQTSAKRLAECDPRLQRVFAEVIKHVDCSVTCGHRGQAEQDAAFAAGTSQLRWPMGTHNRTPSRGIDVVPYPVDWSDTRRFDRFAGFVLGIAASMGIKLRHGGDWDRDWDVRDNRLNDYPHFELAD